MLHLSRPLALEIFTFSSLFLSFIFFHCFPLCPRPPLCTNLLVQRGGRGCFSPCQRCPRDSLSSHRLEINSLVQCTTPASFVSLDSKQVARRCLLEWTCKYKAGPVGESEEEEGVQTTLSMLVLVSALTKEADNHTVERTDAVCTGSWRMCTSWHRHLLTAGGASRPLFALWGR